jgi:hypothetical protein
MGFPLLVITGSLFHGDGLEAWLPVMSHRPSPTRRLEIGRGGAYTRVNVRGSVVGKAV